MIKRNIFIISLLILIIPICYSQNYFSYYSGNWNILSFGECSCAEYFGINNNHSIDEISNYKFRKFLRNCNKLNRTEEKLLFGALNYYNYKPKGDNNGIIDLVLLLL